MKLIDLPGWFQNLSNSVDLLFRLKNGGVGDATIHVALQCPYVLFSTGGALSRVEGHGTISEIELAYQDLLNKHFDPNGILMIETETGRRLQVRTRIEVY